MDIKPPLGPDRLLSLVLREEDYLEKSGDLEEVYLDLVDDIGPFRAKSWFWTQVILALPGLTVNSMYWRLLMLNHYAKSALRNVRNNIGLSIINLSGLAVGMMCCVLLLMWIRDEISYDTFHENADDIYRVVQDIEFSDHEASWAITQGPLGKGLEESFPEVIGFSRYQGENWQFVRGDESFDEIGAYADNSFFELFSMDFVQGNPANALQSPGSVVISEDLADRVFGNGEAVGKVLSSIGETDVLVTGIFRNLPQNSTFQLDFVVPVSWSRGLDDWGGSSYYTFVMLAEDASLLEVNQQISGFLNDKPTREEKATLRLQPLSDIHLNASVEFDFGNLGDIRYVQTFAVVALLLLLIACFNFMSLSTARSVDRAKEVGLRKVVGADRANLITQFYGEALLHSGIAILLSLGLIALFLPAFNQFTGKHLELAANTELVLGLLAIAFVTGLVGGSYPALFLSAFKPVAILRGNILPGSGGTVFRRSLVITQFCLSIILIAGTLIVNSQLDFLNQKDLGFKKDHVMYIPQEGNFATQYEATRNELLQHPGIVNVTAMSSLPTSGFAFANSSWEWDGKGEAEDVLFRAQFVDFDYFETLKMEMAGGRTFSRDFASDRTAVVINEEAARVMGLVEPVGSTLRQGARSLTIIGVVRDYNYRSLHTIIEPLILILESSATQVICLSISPEDEAGTISFIEDTWKTHAPDVAFSYGFLNEKLIQLYDAEHQSGTLLRYFSIIAVFISCLGLFGLAAYTAERRTREIGIRKVLGATIPELVFKLTKEYAVWVLIANFAAWPIVYIVGERWLKNFAYRTDLGWEIFVSAGVGVLMIAIASVSFHTLSAASANPVESIRVES